MVVRHGVAILCGCAVIVAAITARDTLESSSWERETAVALSGDVNGDDHIDVLDVQRAIAALLQSPSSGGSGNGEVKGQPSVLDIQRIMALAQRTQRSEKAPPSSAPLKSEGKGICYGCSFNFLPELVVLKEETATAVPPAPTGHMDQPSVCAIPIATERYLFRLTSNAPPLAV